jgi:hypothetical protein
MNITRLIIRPKVFKRVFSTIENKNDHQRMTEKIYQDQLTEYAKHPYNRDLLNRINKLETRQLEHYKAIKEQKIISGITISSNLILPITIVYILFFDN